MSHATNAMACPPEYSSNLSVLLNMVSYRTYYRIVNIFCSEIIIMDTFSYCIDINLYVSLMNFRNQVSFVQSCHRISKTCLIWFASVPYRLVHGKLVQTLNVSDLLGDLEIQGISLMPRGTSVWQYSKLI